MSERRAVLITGAGRGIGRAIGMDLAERGWDVAFCWRERDDDGRQTERELGARGARTVALAADVSDFAACERLVGETRARFGRIDAVVNAAGPYHRCKLLEESVQGWRSMFQSNLDPVFFTARLAAASMMQRRWGRIVSFSMAGADHVAANTAVTAHFIAKMGVLALTRALARELAPHGITANCISPGFVDSGSAPAAELAAMKKRIPAGTVGTVGDVVAAARYLLSEEAAYVTGANLVVSGGWGL